MSQLKRLAHIDEQLRIIHRNAVLGRHKAFNSHDMGYIDLFQHIEDEAERTRLWLKEVYEPT